MKLLDSNEKEVTILDLGKVNAGESKEYTYYLLNDSDGELQNIEIKIENSEVSILSKPTVIFANQKDVVKIKWSPSLTVKKGLKTSIKIEAEEIYK
jgi:hypothetical protein